MLKKKNDNETISTSLSTKINIGHVYANVAEGDKPGEIVEAGFIKEMRESKNTGKRLDLNILSIKVKFSSEKGHSTYLLFKPIVSQAENSRFIEVMKEFDISFEDGNVDVAGMVGEKVIATIKNKVNEGDFTYSNIETIRRA